MPSAADLDEPAGLIDRVIGGGLGGSDFSNSALAESQSIHPRAGRPD
jgi:hypothetical protein